MRAETRVLVAEFIGLAHDLMMVADDGDVRQEIWDIVRTAAMQGPESRFGDLSERLESYFAERA